MANRPRLPNVDPEDLAKLASQYPGSRSSGGSEGSGDSVSGGSGTGGTGSSGTGGSGTGGATSSLSASSSSRSGSASSSRTGSSSASASTGGGSSASSSTTSPPAKKRGSWSAAFLTFLFAVIALAAAAASIGGPSYRAEIRDLLRAHVPEEYLNRDVIDVITGYDPDRLEVTYDGLDQRIQQLTDAMARVTATEGVSGEDARALLFRDEIAERLDAVIGRLDTLSGRVGTIADETSAQAEQIAGLGTDLTAASDRLSGDLATSVESLRSETTADFEAISAELQDAVTKIEGSIAAVQEEVAAARTDLDALGSRMATAETALDSQVAVDAAMTDRLGALDDRLGTLVSDFNGLLDLSDQVAQTVATLKTENMPILAVIQLRDAVNRSEPYRPELAFARRVLNGAPGVGAALDKLEEKATDGIASAPELRRDLRLIANNFGTFVNKVESWSDRVSGWFTMLVGAQTVPEAREGGNIVASVAAMDDALERGDLELAIREGASLQAELRSPALADWMKAVVERMEMIEALRKLKSAAYGRVTAPAGGQGAGKAN